MPVRRTVAHEWDAFRHRIPEDAAPAQYRDMRRTFYMGVRAGLQLVAEQDLASGGGEGILRVPRDYVNGLVEEVGDFARFVNSGHG